MLGLAATAATASVLIPRFGISGAAAGAATGWFVATTLLVVRYAPAAPATPLLGGDLVAMGEGRAA
jgi:hypothetical protein